MFSVMAVLECGEAAGRVGVRAGAARRGPGAARRRLGPPWLPLP